MPPDDLTPEQQLRRLQLENANFRDTAAKLQTREILGDWLEGQLAAQLLHKIGPQGWYYEISNLSPRIRKELLKDAAGQGWLRPPRYLMLTITLQRGLVLTYAETLDHPPEPPAP